MNFRFANARVRPLLAGWSLFLLPILAACETDSYLDPSRTGYFETTPTAIPILTRIDVIEQDSELGKPTQPAPEDLVPNTLDYRLAPGDAIKVSIPRLISATDTDISERAVDQAGRITLPIIGTMQASGLTVRELETAIEAKLSGILTNAQAFVEVVEARAYQFRVLGAVDAPSLYALNKPDLTVLDALAIARGASPSTTRILITRKVQDAPEPQKSGETKEPASGEGMAPVPGTKAPEAPATPSKPPASPELPPQSIDALLNQLGEVETAGAAANEPGASAGGTSPASPATPPMPPPTEPTPPAAEPTPPASQPAPPAAEPEKPAPQPGMLGPASRPPPPVDIDALEPPVAQAGVDSGAPTAQVDSAAVSDFIMKDGQWVRSGAPNRADAPSATLPADASPEPEAIPGLATGAKARERAKARADKKKGVGTRVIEVDYNQLVRGASNLNVIIRPDDVIYCDTGEVGVVYIGGEIARPGVYNLPTSGKLTLSRLVDAAGGLGQIAIPERVDLIRRIGGDKEACIRVNLAAIRNRAEPDIFMKADDHVIIGTNFWATPLAVIRNGFRMTYGFGFLVDRNWGNDIFGAPPVNVVGQ